MVPLDEYKLEIDGVDATLRPLRVSSRERVHAPFEVDVTCLAEDGAGARAEVDLAAAVAAKAKLTIALPDGGTRVVEGVIDVADAVGEGFLFRLVPVVATLGDAIDHQIFVDKDAVEILEEVLSEHGVTVAKRVTRTLAKRPQCIQAFESDLDFVSRLCAEEGITWFVSRDTAGEIILADNPSAFEDLEGDPLPVRERGGLVSGEALFGARLTSALTPDKVTLCDYDFQKPQLDLTAQSEGEGARERFEYPGGYTAPDVGADLAALRLEQYQGRKKVLRAETSSRRMVPGYVVSLDHPDRSEVCGRWLILEVTQVVASARVAGESEHAAQVVLVPAEGGYRAPRGERPSLGGVQSAVVTGGSGAEIAPDAFGRITVLHRWDRRRPEDDTSSANHRVVQPPLSGGFMQPRVGWEVLVGFQGVSPDRPFILGRLYTGTAPPPSSLPGKKVFSAFGSATTPGGGSVNQIQTDDSAGKEAMNFVASKDWNERTENDKNTAVTADETLTVSADRTLIVGKVYGNSVTGSQTYTVGASRTVNVTANKTINAASETVMIGGARIFDVGGDYRASSATLTRLVGAAKAEAAIEHSNRAVKGASTVLVGASWNTIAGASASVSVLGASTELVSAVKSIKASRVAFAVKGVLNETLASRKLTAGGDRTESFSGAASYKIAGSAKLSGADITVKATSKITLKAGGVTITITPGAVKISGNVKSAVQNEDSGDITYG